MIGSFRDKSADAAKSDRRAVVDIGSNSVRLVVYDGPSRAPLAICNEKSLCGLGRDMTEDGRLNPAAVIDAKSTLARFRQLLKEYGDPPTYAIATSAMREAKDGEAFVSELRELGFDVSIITGSEEAELAAYGVISFEPDATGVAGDMGGGSLELVSLDKAAIDETVSLPVGPLSVMHRVGDNLKEAKSLIDLELDRATFLKKKKYDTLYSVGGAWRAIARINMRLRSYPLPVLHHYEMLSLHVRETCELIARQSRRSLEEIPGIPRRRLDTLPYAAVVMQSVLERMNASKVVVSAGGVREGLLYRALSDEARKADPFIAACEFYAGRLSPNPDFGEAARSVVEPLFAGDAARARLRTAAYILMDIGAFFHPDLRGRHAFDTAMWAPFVSVSHEERVWMALALFSRYQGRTSNLPNEQAISLLNDEAQLSAVQFGLALRFVASFAPKIGAPLQGCRLEYEPGKIVFRAPPDRRAMMAETPRKRFESLSAAFGAIPVEVYE